VRRRLFRHHALTGGLAGKSFDLAVALVNTGRAMPTAGGTLAYRNRFPVCQRERQDAMNEKEKASGKPARTEDDREKRRERDKALDKALEDSFPASDPISPSAPASTRE